MIRRAVHSDCEAIYALICSLEATQLPFQEFCSIFHAQQTDDHYDFLVYEEGGSVLGGLNLRFERQLHHAAQVAEIMEFVVDASARSRGIGHELLTRTCQIAKERGCVQIEAASNQSRTEAHRFYLREGMQNSHFKFCLSLTEDTVPDDFEL